MNAKAGRILCVDDEPHVLRALRWLLQKDFDLYTAASAEEALRLVQGHDFDVVVSDQRMPGVTGVEFLREVRRVAPRAMRILLTGYSDLDAMVRSVNDSEVFRFVTKPWDIRELPKLIAEAAKIARTEPVVPAQPEEAEGAAEPVRKNDVTTVALNGSESILLVDDSPEVHEAVSQVVGDAMPVQHAYSLPDAVRILSEKPIGVIVSEVQVGKLDATRLVRLLKSKHPDIVSVVFSAQKDAEVVMTLINQGQVYRFIPKPLKPGFTRIVLNSALKRRRELLRNPALRRRFAVEATSQGVADSLLQDIRQAAAAAAGAAPAPRASAPVADASGEGLVSRLSLGFRRLFSG